VTSVVCMDSTDTEALQTLSLEKFDGVFVTFSKDFGTSVQTVALLKSLGVSRIVVRAISAIHATVLRSIGVERIITPEEDFALHYALQLMTRDLFEDRYAVDARYAVLTLKVPESMVGEKVQRVGFGEAFKLDLLCVRRPVKRRNLLGRVNVVYEVLPWEQDAIELQAHDQLVVFGLTENLKAFGTL
ncbi:MAG: NAD-binding protein, partial [Bacteroidales bacterium]|nr:NAD-binding protein [Bacteroidales bacterium]